MKIFVLHLGGTIACTEQSGKLYPNADIRPYFKQLESKDVSFTHKVCSPFLSEHLDSTLINIGVKEVKRAIESKKYSGIILTHGSDTIAYTSCALAYALGSSCIPVVTVCADLPLSDPASSGHINLLAALTVIKSGSALGVFSVYRSDDKSANVFRATRLLHHRTFESELKSTGIPYGKVSFIEPGNAIFEKNPSFSEQSDMLLPLDFKLGKTCPVWVLSVYPSMECPKPSRSCRAIIFSTYHSGTLDTKNPQIRKLCAICKRRKIAVFADGGGACSEYGSSDAFEELGILRLPPLSSPIAMLMKIWALTRLARPLSDIGLSLGSDIVK